MSAPDERAAFDRLIAPHLDELLRAARRELRYRIALGELGSDDLSHEAPDAPLPDAVARGAEPFLVVGAMAGG